MKTDRSSSDRRWRNRNLVRERDERLARWLWGMLVSLVVALAPVLGPLQKPERVGVELIVLGQAAR